MALLLLFHPLCRKLWNAVFPLPSRSSPSRSSPDDANARLEQRASFDYIFAFIFLIALHGFSAFKVLLILYVNYSLTTGLPRKYVPVVTWVFNVGILFANELCQGYRFKPMASFITPPAFEKDLNAVDPILVQWGEWLDSYGGLMSRWEVLFNITILRLVSFNLDHYWSYDKRNASSIEVCVSPVHSLGGDRGFFYKACRAHVCCFPALSGS
jgi:protein-cysteine N-palmitoyltransferase HHAT